MRLITVPPTSTLVFVATYVGCWSMMGTAVGPPFMPLLVRLSTLTLSSIFATWRAINVFLVCHHCHGVCHQCVVVCHHFFLVCRHYHHTHCAITATGCAPCAITATWRAITALCRHCRDCRVVCHVLSGQ